MKHLALLLLSAFALSNIFGSTASPLRYEPSNTAPITNSSLMRLLDHIDAEKLLQYRGKLVDKNCVICKIIVGAFLPIIRNTAEQFEYSVLFKLAEVLCTALDIESKSVCYQVIPQYSSEIVYLINYGIITPDDICTVLLRSTCGTPMRRKQYWNVTLPGGNPAPYNWPVPQQSAPRLRVLHVSDIHVDLKYVPGSLAECKDPQCCRAEDGLVNDSRAAGLWGDYRNCDTPVWTAEAFFRWLADHQDTFDVIYWTGDLPPHHVWNQTAQEQLEVYQVLMNLFRKYIPNKKVFPAVGNHESAPADSFPPHYVPESRRNQWLYDALAQHWSTWLDPQAINTVRYAAFYSTLVQPGFRLISLNTMFADSNNFWILVNETDPDGMLSWFASELLLAERNGERVHVIGHIPSGSMMEEFSRNFNRIVNRFRSTIAGLFFGHTHKDHFEVYYERDDQVPATSASHPRPIATGYIAPSITPFSFLNIGYRVYDIDGLYPNSSFGVLGWTQYIMNLSDANARNNTAFFQEYNTHDAYQLDTAYPADMDRLTDRFRADRTLFDLFYKYHFKSSPYQTKCDESCRQALICSLNSAQNGDHEYCSGRLRSSDSDSQVHQLGRTFNIALRNGLVHAQRSLMRKP